MAKSKLDSKIEDEELHAVERLRELAPAGFILKIYRQEPGQRVWPWLDDWTSDVFPTEATLRETYGGGAFRLELHNADNSYVKGGRAVVNIAGPPKLPAAATAGGTSNVDATVKFALETMQKMVQDQREAKPSKPLDLPALIIAISTAVTALGALLSGRGGGGLDVKGLRELIELAKTLTPEGGGGSDGGIAGALVEGVHTLAGLVSRQAQLPAPPATPGAGGEPAPEAAGGGKPGPGPTVVAAPGEEWLVALAPYLPDLLELAADDVDPALYADLYVDQLARKQPLVLGFLDEKLAGDTGAAALFQQQFFRAVPDAGQYSEWFTDLFTELRRSLLERRKDLEEEAAERARLSIPKGPEKTADS